MWYRQGKAARLTCCPAFRVLLVAGLGVHRGSLAVPCAADMRETFLVADLKGNPAETAPRGGLTRGAEVCGREGALIGIKARLRRIW